MKIQESQSRPLSTAAQQPAASEQDQTRPSAPDISSGDVDHETARDMQEHQGNQEATRATEATRSTPPVSQTPVLDAAQQEGGEAPGGGGEAVEQGDGGHASAEPGDGGGFTGAAAGGTGGSGGDGAPEGSGGGFVGARAAIMGGSGGDGAPEDGGGFVSAEAQATGGSGGGGFTGAEAGGSGGSGGDGAPEGGGGGGGFTGVNAGATAVVAESSEPVEGKDVKEYAENYKKATPTEKARSYPEVGGKIDDLSKESNEELQESIPEFHATLQDNAPLDGEGGPTRVETPSPNTRIDGGATGQVDTPNLPPTPDQGHFEGNADAGSTVNRLGGEADESAKASAISQEISAMTTGDQVPTSPGPPPAVPTTGDTDLGRTNVQRESANAEVVTGQSEARTAVIEGPGPEAVQPLEMDEPVMVPEVNTPEIEPPQDIPEMAEDYLDLPTQPEVQPAFDQLVGPEMEASVAEAESQVADAVDQKDEQSNAEIEKATQEAQKLTEETQAEQDQAVQDGRAEIEQEKQSAVQKQNEAVGEYRKKADAEGARVTGEGQRRIAKDESTIKEKYRKAESQSKQEVKKGEEKAAKEKKKKEEEAKNKSWWERAVSAISDLVSAIADAIGAIFDAVRDVVAGILDAVKTAANAIIDAACSFLTSLIDAFGFLLKGMIQTLLGAVFPEIADALCKAVDAVVDYAKKKVEQLGEALKKGIAAIVDVVNAVINTIINAYQAAVNMALGVLQAVLTGDWAQILLKVLESALQLCGISPDEFYALIGKVETTIEIIVNDPGAFLSNIIDAVAKGFGQFADNFLTHLQKGFLDWLTGQAGDTGITLPDQLDLEGVFSIVLQVMGLTREKIREKAVEHIGEENVARIEFVWGFVESTIEGGLEGLWQHIQGYLDTLWDDVIGAIQDWLMQKIIMAAVTKLATMFNPVGAIVQALITAWNLYCFIRDEIQRIYGVVRSVVDSISDIALGNIANAANMVEGALADLVPVAISLLANLLGLGGIGKKVRGIIEAIQNKVWEAIDKVIEKFLGLFKGGGGEENEEGETEDEGEAGEGGTAAGLPTEQFTDAQGEEHTLRIHVQGGQPVVMQHSDPKPVGDAFKTRDEIIAKTKQYLDPSATAAQKDALKREIDALLDRLAQEMAEARGDEGAIQKEREKLEQAIGAAAANDAGAKASVQEMATLALRMVTADLDESLATIEEIDAAIQGVVGNPELREALKDLGTKLGKGFAGAVGKNYQAVLAALQRGNMREQITVLNNFGKWFAEKVFETHPDELRRLLERVRMDDAQIQQILLQKKATEGSYSGRDANKKLFTDASIDDPTTGASRRKRTPGYAKAKHSEMDAKAPSVPLEMLTHEQLLVKARAEGIRVAPDEPDASIIQRISDKQASGNVGVPDKYQTIVGSTGGGEADPRTRSERGRDEIPVPLSSREGRAKGLSDEVLPYLEGWKANIVDAENDWIKKARDELQMPIKSGISGTTYRWMHMASLLGADKYNARLAMMAYLMPDNMHSFHEICVAASAYVRYKHGTYVPLLPWDDSKVFDLARSAGVDPTMIDSVVLGTRAPSGGGGGGGGGSST